MEQNLEALIQKIDQSDKTPEVVQYMQNISQPQFGLINLMIQEFLKDINSSNERIEIQNGILRTLRKLNEWVPNLILLQMRENKDFPICLRDYCIKRSLKEKVGDAYVLMTLIYQNGSFLPIINEQFINVLINDISYLKNEEVLNQIVLILIHIIHNLDQQNPNQNMALEQLQQNLQCQAIMSQTFSLVFNLVKLHDVEACVNLINTVIRNSMDTFFFKGDLQIIIEILIRQIKECSIDSNRILYIDALHNIVKSNQYKRINYHQKDEIMDMASQIELLSQNDQVKQKSQLLYQSLN